MERRSLSRKAVAIGSIVLGGLGALALFSLRRSTGALPSTKRIALIGDSYAAGLGPELAKLFPHFKFEGHVGTNTWQWAAHAADCGQCGDWLTTFKPDVVLVSLGVNDGATPDAAKYNTIVRDLHGIGARVLWIEPPAGVDAPAVRKVIASLGVDTVPAMQMPMASGGLHPQSYGPWAREIVARVT